MSDEAQAKASDRSSIDQEDVGEIVRRAMFQPSCMDEWVCLIFEERCSASHAAHPLCCSRERSGNL